MPKGAPQQLAVFLGLLRRLLLPLQLRDGLLHLGAEKRTRPISGTPKDYF